jgi:hypothetical protein
MIVSGLPHPRTKGKMDIIDKVRKLLKLSESSNANEAALAAAAAQRLIDEYNLSAALLSVETDEPENEPIEDTLRDGKPLDAQKKLQTWRYALADVLAEVNGCQIYRYKGSIELTGRKSDTDKVRYLYGYLINETNRLCDRDGEGCGRTWRNNYRIGVVDTIALRLREEHNKFKNQAREQVSSDSVALVKVDKALARIDARRTDAEDWLDKNRNIRHRMTSAKGDELARLLGRIAGQSITIGNARAALK